MPKVSVILTSFNHEKYLREAIDSVLNQTFTNFELIIWDDASSDNSWFLINQYSDPRIRTFRNDESRGGIAYGINKAISEVAAGKYIAIHHSDDVWEPEKLEKQVAFLDANADIGAVFTNALAITEDGSPLTDEKHFYFNIFNQHNRTRHEWLNHFFYKGNALCHPSVLIRKKCYEECGRYRFGLAQLPDFDMWIRLCLQYEIHVLPEKLVRFRVQDNEANASGNRPETRIRGIYEFYKLLSNYRKLTRFDDLVKIFPSAVKYDRKERADMDFVLAMIALEEKHFTFTTLFGQDLLFEIISDPKRSDSIKRLYDFDYKSFIALTAKNDVFSREEVSALWCTVAERDRQIAELNEKITTLIQTVAEREGQIANLDQALTERDARIANLNQAVNERDGQIAALYHSTSWRITWPLRIVGHQVKRYSKAAVKIGKSVYRRLPSSLKIKTSLQPIVSIIIPIYGHCDYTLRCLASIADNPTATPFEIIIVDDCSPDRSAKILKRVKGIRLISKVANEGFIRACNIGAEAARGEYLCFLNNDTEVTPGWMDELLRTFQEFPGTGLAGSKLLYPDGSLQEAGCIIWRNGSAWNFGHHQDALLPLYNYAREVDYCSGASLMVPKTLFDELGGFDEHYLPAYCEDADLALKIRDRSYRIIYQPLSVVVHYEGITSGTDTTQGAKAYQVENSNKLFERWKERLQHHQAPGTDIDKAKDRTAKRRVLVLDHCTPTPDQDAGSVIAFNLLLLLREMGFQVTFVPEDNSSYVPNYTSALQRAGIEVLYAPFHTSVRQHLKEFGGRYDLAVLFRPDVVDRHLKAIRKYSSKAKVLFHTVDLHHLRMSREADMLGDAAKQKAADDIKQRELAAIRESDASIVVSTAELELLQKELHGERIYVFPLIMGIRGTKMPFKGRQNIVFVGGYQHTPNVDAVQYFVAEIMPLVRQRLPGVHFYVVGSKPPAEIQSLAAEDVIVTGFVKNLEPLLDRMRVSVAPLRYGAGIKGKIGSAMAVGLPVVATPLAAEGMSLTDGENILVARDAEQFADAVVRLYQDEAFWNQISHNGLKFADNAWGAEAAWKILNTILTDISITTSRGVYPLSLFS